MLSDEEKKAINLLKSYENKLVYEISEKDKKAVKTVLNLIEKQSKEIEEYKKQLDLDYVDKHFVPIERYNQLEKEIEELKDESKEYQIGFAQGCYEKDLDWKDKIKAKIEDYEKIDNPVGKRVLQSLLEKE